MNEKIKKVLVVGGTHGNESTGVFLVNKWQRKPSLLTRSSIQVDTFIANPKAITQNRRYIDFDLNRCFSDAVLNDRSLTGYEFDRAQDIVNELGGKGECRYDLIIDLHTSTANMKTNLVLTNHQAFQLKMMAYALSVNDDVVVTSEAEMIPDHHFLCALAKYNVIVEVGPVPQGVLHHETIEKTERMVMQLLDFVEGWNTRHSEILAKLPKKIDVYEYTGKEPLPVDKEGQVIGFVHKELQGKDFSEVKAGTPLFETMEGDIIQHTGDARYVSFINEAAYYDKKLGFCWLRKTTLTF